MAVATTAQALLSAFSPYRQSHHQAWNPDPTVPKKYRTRTYSRPATEKEAAWHLNGRWGLGISPLIEGECGDGEYFVRWGVLDVDDLELRLTDADELAGRFWASGLPFVPCRSKSGDLHAYLFLREPIRASDMRCILRGCALKLGFNPDDHADIEVFPKNVRPGRKGYSPGINLPYFAAATTDGTVRYAIDGRGQHLSVRGFFEAVEAMRAWPEQLPWEDWPQGHPGDDSSGISDGIVPWQPPSSTEGPLDAVARTVVEAWKAANGRRAHHALALGVGGMLARAQFPLDDALRIAAAAVRDAGDDELDDRLQAVSDMYRAVAEAAAAGKRPRCAGRSVVRTQVGETLAEGVYRALTRWRNAEGKGKGKALAKDVLGAALEPAPGEIASGGSAEGSGGGPPPGASTGGSGPDKPGKAQPPAGQKPIALEIMTAYLLGKIPELNDRSPILTWREGSRCYASRTGRIMSGHEFSGRYSPPLLAYLLANARELQSTLGMDSEYQKQKHAIAIFKQWISEAYQDAMDQLPERAEVENAATRAEAKSMERSLAKMLVQTIRYSREPSEIPYNTSIIQVARRCMSPHWIPVAHYPAYVRHGRRVAVRYDLFRASNDPVWEHYDRMTLGKRLAELGLAEKAKHIRVDRKRVYAIVLSEEFLDRQFGADETLGDQGLEDSTEEEAGEVDFNFGASDGASDGPETSGGESGGEA